MLLPLIFTVLGLAVGFGLYLALINRTLSYMRHSVSKPLVSLTSLVFLLSGFACLGFAGGVAGYWLISLTLFGLIIGEIYLFWVRHRLLGAPPVTRQGPKPSVFRPITTTDLVLLHYVVPVCSAKDRENYHLQDS